MQVLNFLLGTLSDLWDQPATRALVAVAVLMIAVYVGYQVVMALRHSTHTSDMNADSLTENFEEMMLEGDIDPAELRKIKAVLGKNQESPGDE